MRAALSFLRAARRDSLRCAASARQAPVCAKLSEASMGGQGEPAGHARRIPALSSAPYPSATSLRYRRAMLVRRFDDPLAFQEAATPYLVREEARHNLLLGVSTTLIQRPDLYEAFDLWVVSDGDDVTGAALRTHPLNLVLAQPSHDEALGRARRSAAPGGSVAPGRDRGAPRARGVRRRVDVGERSGCHAPASVTVSMRCGKCCPSRQLPVTHAR